MPIHGYPGNVITANPTAPTSSVATGVWTTEQQLLAVSQGNWPGYEYPISNSLRFNSADSAYLSRTPASVSADRTRFTFSCWLKRGSLTDSGVTLRLPVFGAGPSSGQYTQITTADGSGALKVELLHDGALKYSTLAVLRDPSAWCNLVVQGNSNETVTNRIKIWINNVQYTTSVVSEITSADVFEFGNTVAHYVGKFSWANYYFDGYMTEVNFIDGQALTPSSFGLNDPETGVWSPKRYTGTYGTNGFYLNFSDNSNTTAATLGKDYSGNGNNWTPNNFSVTAGAGNDSLVDSPTSYGTDTGAGGEVRGNYATLNPIAALTGTYSNGNLDFVTATADSTLIANVVMSSGKWYCETTKTAGSANPIVGICSPSAKNGFAPTNANQHPSVVYASSTGQKFINGTGTSYGSTYTTNDVIGIAFDADARELTFYKNGTSQGTITGVPSGDMVFCVGDGDNVNTYTGNFNFGQRAFEKWNGSAYVANTAPSGFKALCTQNLPPVTIGATSTTQANKYMDVTLYTGNQTVRSITNSGSMQPDFVWDKLRSGANSHRLFDAVRGVEKALYSNLTNIEATETGTLTSFNSNGFSLGTNTETNTTGSTYVAWQWNAGGSNQTISVGQYATSPANVPSIASTVRANTTSGFSIVTGTLGAAGVQSTVGHGLNAVPNMILFKTRSGATYNWSVFHVSISTDTTKYLRLNDTSATLTYSTVWGAALPTNQVFGVTGDGCGSPSNPFVAYCFSAVAGYSAFGSYTGNGSADGPFIYTGFRPRWLLRKRYDPSTTSDWQLIDTAREEYNPDDSPLWVNLSNAQSPDPAFYVDMLSNGFKLRGTTASTNLNASGGTYIYAAFAEAPFKYSRAR